MFPEFVAHNVNSIIDKGVLSLSRTKLEEPRSVKSIAGTSHKKKMGGRGGGIGEKTAKDVRFIVKVELWNREVDRLRGQNSIEGDHKGSKKAGAGNDMRQTFRTMGAEWARAKIGNIIRKSNSSAPGIGQRSDYKTTKNGG